MNYINFFLVSEKQNQSQYTIKVINFIYYKNRKFETKKSFFSWHVAFKQATSMQHKILFTFIILSFTQQNSIVYRQVIEP